MRRDIDEALQDWPYQPDRGELLVRETEAGDGRKILQIRVELGLLQLEVTGRPDGKRFHGRRFETYLEYLLWRTRRKSSAARSRGRSKPWRMTPKDCEEADRELVQFYHRRIAWLTLQRYAEATRDADHTLALMDFIRDHGFNPEYVAAHERHRGLVLFHRSQAVAAIALEDQKPEEAIQAIRDGIEELRAHAREWPLEEVPGASGKTAEGLSGIGEGGGEGDSDSDAEDEEGSPPAFDIDLEMEDADDHALIEQLEHLEDEIRKNFEVEKSLREQLEDAVAVENYELAARLRDKMRASQGR